MTKFCITEPSGSKLITVVMQPDHRAIMKIPKMMPSMLMVQLLLDGVDATDHDVIVDGGCDIRHSHHDAGDARDDHEDTSTLCFSRVC